MGFIDVARRDLQHTIRMFLKTPGFTVAAAATLGLGIGANTALFSLMKAVLVEPLPYSAPDRLVAVWDPAHPRETTHLSVREIVSYAEEVRSLETVAGYTETNANLTGDANPERVRAAAVTVNLFDTLGVAPILGRTLTATDGQPGGQLVVMLSHGLWQTRFGAASDVVGRSVIVNGRARTVVGVMPPSFRLPLDFRSDRPTEIWLPLAIDPVNLGAWGDRSYYAIGRLAPGIAPAAATSELAGVTGRWVQAGYDGFRGGVNRRDAVPLHELITGAVRTPLVVLQGAVVVVLLIACANVVNLMLARAGVRRHEIAIRTAIGATRQRLMSQMAVEAAGLALLGALSGLAIAYAALRLVVVLRPANVPRLDGVALDPLVLGFCATLSVLSALLVGLAPAFKLVTSTPVGLMSDSGRGATSSRRRRSAQRVLVVVQLAFSVVLVVGAALLLRTLAELHRIDLGFEPRNVLTAQVQLSPADYPTDERVVEFYRQLTERVQQLPGVIRAGAVRVLPLARTIGDYSITIEGKPRAPGENPNGDFQWVTPGYFAAMGVTLLHGRLLTDHDRQDAPLVAIINETMAKRYWPGGDALGRRFHMGGSTQMPPVTIVGIVRGTRHNTIVEPERAEMYLPHAQLPRSVGGAARSMALIVKTAGDPLTMAGPLRDVVRALDSNLPLAEVRTMEDIADAALSTPRFATLVLSVFAVLALSLAIIGIYATVSLLVAERSLEIGIRMALGAQWGSIFALVIREAAMVTAAGLTVGLIGAYISSRSLESLLYGVRRLDPATFVAVPALLAIVALAACVNPARRAAAVDPAVTLRQG